jgi:hypothetical protein
MAYWSEKELQEYGVTQTALSILVAAGTLSQCEPHGTHFQGSGDLTTAYKYANASLSEGGADISADTRRELTDAVKAAYAEHEFMTCCEECARHR